MKRNILLNPGPSTTTQSVKNSLVVPDICPREEEFKTIIKSIRDGLTKIAGGDNNYTTVLFGGSGTATMEAVMNSVMSDGKLALILTNGMYGRRFKEIADVYKIPDFEISCPWGENINLKKIDYILDRCQFIEAVFVIHHETTTGILNPIKEIGRIVKKHNKIYVVDAISSFAGIPFSIEDCNIDFLISTSNKCLQGMAGVSFVVGKKSEFEKCRFNNRSIYLNMYNQYRFLEKEGEMQFTPPAQVMYALRQAIDEFLDEGAHERYMRYSRNHRTLMAGMERLGFKRFLSDDVAHSHILETYYLPEGLDFQIFHNKLYEKGFTIYPGRLSDENTFRLAIIGNLYQDDIESFLGVVDEVMK